MRLGYISFTQQELFVSFSWEGLGDTNRITGQNCGLHFEVSRSHTHIEVSVTSKWP